MPASSGGHGGSVRPDMETPPADPRKLLDAWMAWEKGEVTPGRTLADLKIAGLRQVLEDLAAEGATADVGGPAAGGPEQA